jgi:hypothetical protein
VDADIDLTLIRRAITLLALVAALVASGCGDSSYSSPVETPHDDGAVETYSAPSNPAPPPPPTSTRTAPQSVDEMLADASRLLIVQWAVDNGLATREEAEQAAAELTDEQARRVGQRVADAMMATGDVPDDFCETHVCIPNFDEGVGSIVQCADGTYSHSGGIQGACSWHGGIG